MHQKTDDDTIQRRKDFKSHLGGIYPFHCPPEYYISILPLKYPSLTSVFYCGSSMQGKKEVQTSTIKFNLFCCENYKFITKLTVIIAIYKLGRKTPWT